MKLSPWLATLSVSAALLLSACGNATTTVPASTVSESAAPAAPTAPAPTVESPAASASSPTNPLPVMDVTDIKTGQPVALASFLDGKKPLLVWFWAPH
jgi:hypothetical protein